MEYRGSAPFPGFDELRHFLVSAETPSTCMDISALEGFLTALVIGPSEINEKTWIPLIWGHTSDTPIKWESDNQKSHYYQLVRTFHHVLRKRILSDPWSIGLTVYFTEDGSPILNNWCEGFFRLIQLDNPGWEKLVESESIELLYAVLLHTEFKTRLPKEILQAADKIPETEWMNRLMDAIPGIYHFWHE